MAKRSSDEIRKRQSKRLKDVLKPLLLKPGVGAAIDEIQKGANSLHERVNDPLEFAEYVGFKSDFAPASAWKTCTENGVGVYVHLDDRDLPVAVPFAIDSSTAEYVRCDLNQVFPNSMETDGPPSDWIKIEYRRNAPLDVVANEFAELVRNLREMGKLWDLGNPDRGKPARRGKTPGTLARDVDLYLKQCLGKKPAQLAKEFAMSAGGVRKAVNRLTAKLRLRAPSEITEEDGIFVGKCRQCEDFPCADCPCGPIIRSKKNGPSLRERLGSQRDAHESGPLDARRTRFPAAD